MATSKKQNAWERRLREIEREKAAVRGQLEEVRRWADALPDTPLRWQEPRLRGNPSPDARGPVVAADPYSTVLGGVGVMEVEAGDVPANETSLDFAPGPEGLDTKRVVMPRLQRTDLLRPAIGGGTSAAKLMEPEYDRFRNYFGTTGLKRVREARKERGSQRIRTLFLIVMVLTLGFILFKMVT